MLISSHVHRAFDVRSSQPDLVIQYVCSPFSRAMLLLLMSPFIALFLGHCAILLLALKSLLTFNVGEFFNTLSYASGYPLCVLLFGFVLTYKSLWRFREVSIPVDSIDYFHQRLQRDGMSGDSWELEVVTNQRLSSNINSLPSWLPNQWNSEALTTRLNYKIVKLFSHHKQTPVSWLGEVLADFYKAELRSKL